MIEKGNIKLLAAAVALSLSLGYAASATASVTVPSDVRMLADSLKNEARDQAVKEKAARESRNNIQQMEQQLAKLQDETATAADEDLLARLDQAKKDLSKAILEQTQLQTDRARLEQQLKDVDAGLTAQKNKFSSLDNQLQAAGEGDYADKLYAEEVRLEPIIAELEAQDAAIYSRMQAMDTKLAAMAVRIGKLDEINDKLGKQAETAISRTDRQNAAALLTLDIDQEKKNLYEYENVTVKKRHSSRVSLDSHYYSWTDNRGNSGSQLYFPFSYSVVHNAWEYGIDGGVAFSNNKQDANRGINTLTDTTIGAAYTQPLKHGDALIYGLSLNLPTGTDALHGNGPVMSDELVEKERFGEGFNIVPEIWWHHKVTNRSTLILGTYYTFAGSYNLDNTHSDSRLNPGNSWVKTVQWKYLSPKVQYLAELSHTSYGNSSSTTDHYRSGDRLAPNFTVNYLPDDKQFFTVYWWNSHEKPLADTNLKNPGETQIGSNFGLQWAKLAGSRGRVRLYWDHLRDRGENYDPLTNLTTDQRQKNTYGVGYDLYFGKEKQTVLSFSLETFRMADYGGQDGDNRYHGCNFYVHFGRSL